VDRDPLGICDDPIVIRFDIPWLIGDDAEESGTDRHQPAGPESDETAQLHPVAKPPSPADLVARWREGLAEAAAEAAHRASMPESRLVMGGVRGHPSLAVSGVSDGEVTLWRRGSDAAEPQALAALTLDRDGSQLLAGGKFVGRWFEIEGEALFLPDWLRRIGPDHVQLASEDPDGNPVPENPEKRLIEKEFKHLERAEPQLGGGRPSSGQDPVLQPPVPLMPRHGTSEPGQVVAPRGETQAMTPTRRRGAPIKVRPGTNPPAMIGGRYYSGHALDQMQSRGILPSVVEYTIARGVHSPSSEPDTTKFYDPANGLVVVVNQAGGVVTTWFAERDQIRPRDEPTRKEGK
jgi:hypothetical protein